jgi:hypothetical protein
MCGPVWLPPWLSRTTSKKHHRKCFARSPSRDLARRLSACSGVDGSAWQGREDIPDRQSREDMPQRRKANPCLAGGLWYAETQGG